MCNWLWSAYIINLLFSYNFFKLIYSLFIIYIIFIIFIIFIIILLWKWYTFSCDTALDSEIYYSFIFIIFINISGCVVSFLWGSHWFVILHLECSTQNFWGVCVTRQTYGDLMVILGSPRVTYYTGCTFDFNVNYSYLYLFKIKYIVL